MVTGIGPIPLDTCLPKQHYADLAMRRAGNRAIKGTQNPTQPCAPWFSRKEPGRKPSSGSEGIQTFKAIKTLLHFRRRPKHIRDQPGWLEKACPDDCQLKVSEAVRKQDVLLSVRAEQDGDLTGNF